MHGYSLISISVLPRSLNSWVLNKEERKRKGKKEHTLSIQRK
jgi:hypothetical protein